MENDAPLGGNFPSSSHYAVVHEGQLLGVGYDQERAIERATARYTDGLPPGWVTLRITDNLAAAAEAGVVSHWSEGADGRLDVDLEHLIFRIDEATGLLDLLRRLQLLEECGIDCLTDVDLEEMPTFGGSRPNIEGALSWDWREVLVLSDGADGETFQVVPR